MNDTVTRMEIFSLLLGALGRDFVTEDLIRDVKKIEQELFPDDE